MPCQAARNSTLMPEAKSFNLKVTGIMKKLFYSLAVLAAVTACNKEIEQQPAPVVGEGVDFIATFEDADTRVYLGEDYFYRWEAGDPVSVFTGSNHDQYKAATGNVVETTLEYVSTTATLGSTLSENYAVYPYNAANTIENGVVSTTLPAEQTYNPAVPTGINNAIMVSKASGTEFVFKNSCALVKVNLKVAEDFSALHSVKSIRVLSKSRNLSGPVSVNVAGGDYTAKVDEASSSSRSVRLIGCETAGVLSTEEVLTFYLAIPAGTYAAGDLTVFVATTSASSTSFNQSFNLTKQYTVNRSQYIEVTATMGKGYDWFEENDDEVIIKEDVILVDKAIMCDEDNLLRQNFRGHDSYDKVFDIPSGDFSITGAQLVESGDASEGPSGPTITFKKTDAEVFIVNTFTTTTSGYDTTKDNPNTVTVSNLTITGELQANCMGIYVNDRTIANGGWGAEYNQGAFHTVWNDVNVLDCKIIPFNSNDKKLGAAVCVYGKAELNNCTVKGTVKSPYVDTHYPEYSDFPYYDMAATNSSHTIVTGGEIGSIFGWEQAKFTFGGGAVIGSLYTIGISNSDFGRIVVNDATVGELTMNPYYGTYTPMLTLSASAKVGTLTFVDTKGELYDSGYWAKVKILTGATVDKVVLEGVGEYTLAEFISTYNIATN